jgi:hypothetical protein
MTAIPYQQNSDVSKFVSHYINLAMSVGRSFYKMAISSSRLIIGKASHIERFQEHAGKSGWDVIPHDA